MPRLAPTSRHSLLETDPSNLRLALPTVMLPRRRVDEPSSCALRPLMFDLSRFSLSDMTRCGMELRRLGEHASGMEEVGERTVRYFYEHLRTADLAQPACVLVRVFVTQPLNALDDGQRHFAE